VLRFPPRAWLREVESSWASFPPSSRTVHRPDSPPRGRGLRRRAGAGGRRWRPWACLPPRYLACRHGHVAPEVHRGPTQVLAEEADLGGAEARAFFGDDASKRAVLVLDASDFGKRVTVAVSPGSRAAWKTPSPFALDARKCTQLTIVWCARGMVPRGFDM